MIDKPGDHDRDPSYDDRPNFHNPPLGRLLLEIADQVDAEFLGDPELLSGGLTRNQERRLPEGFARYARTKLVLALHRAEDRPDHIEVDVGIETDVPIGVEQIPAFARTAWESHRDSSMVGRSIPGLGIGIPRLRLVTSHEFAVDTSNGAVTFVNKTKLLHGAAEIARTEGGHLGEATDHELDDVGFKHDDAEPPKYETLELIQAIETIFAEADLEGALNVDEGTVSQRSTRLIVDMLQRFGIKIPEDLAEQALQYTPGS